MLLLQKEEGKKGGKSSTPSQRTFVPRSQRGRLSVSSLRPLVSSAPAKVSLPNPVTFQTSCVELRLNIINEVALCSSSATFETINAKNLVENCDFHAMQQKHSYFKIEASISFNKMLSTGTYPTISLP